MTSKPCTILCLLLLTALPLPGAGVADAQDNRPPVRITSPLGGWSSARIITLEAEIGLTDTGLVELVENGNARRVRVRDGMVRENLVLSPGNNQIVVQVFAGGRMYRDEVNLYSEVPRKDIKIILTWDTDGTDVDLHVINPAGVDCYYGNKETEEGGRLDVDVVDGYGPEVFTQAVAVPGNYQIKVHYFSSNGHPQTRLQVQVILFEGTASEKVYRFGKVLTKTGDDYLVGEFPAGDLDKPE